MSHMSTTATEHLAYLKMPDKLRPFHKLTLLHYTAIQNQMFRNVQEAENAWVECC